MPKIITRSKEPNAPGINEAIPIIEAITNTGNNLMTSTGSFNNQPIATNAPAAANHSIVDAKISTTFLLVVKSLKNPYFLVLVIIHKIGKYKPAPKSHGQ